jgi:hypothetical protein
LKQAQAGPEEIPDPGLRIFDVGASVPARASTTGTD